MNCATTTNDVENGPSHKVNCKKPPLDVLIADFINNDDYNLIIIDDGIDQRIFDI